ncbi:MAG TPA: hypothetical protein VNK89_08330, partial [Thermoflexus sp.]|nr:hypothetical protein [Thermoflexus sp.]
GDEFVPHQDLNKREAVAAADNSLIFVNETEQSQRISKASGGFGPLDPPPHRPKGGGEGGSRGVGPLARTILHPLLISVIL